MQKVLVAVLVGVGFTFVALPAAASANTISPTCNGASCTGWFNATVNLAWNVSPPADGGTIGCVDQAVTDETSSSGASFNCDATWTTGTPLTDSAAVTVKIDLTKPTVTGANPSGSPNGAGWFRSPVSFEFTGSDALSGVAGCSNPSYNGPDSATASVSGTCTDNAGNASDSVAHPFKYDATPPTGTAVPSRPADAAGWYNQPVSFNFALGAADATSGIASCDSPVTYGGPNTLNASVAAGKCTDRAGNQGSINVPPFNYDNTNPVIASVGANRPPDSGGWYNHPVSVSAASSASPGPSGIACGPVGYGGPDGAGIPVTAGCATGAGRSASGATAINYDATAPAVTGAIADRPPDHGGYYNHPVTFSFTGVDATSGIQSCDKVTYSGPDDATAHVTGSCRDNAGNINLRSFEFKYDATKPRSPQLVATPGSKRVDLSWTGTDAVSFVVTRSVMGSTAGAETAYSGTNSNFVDTHVKNGVRYIYAVTASDRAGNTSSASIRAIPTASSLRPFAGTAVGSAPLLTWKKVKRARYYNIQLWRGGKKVLTAWPGQASFQVPQRWGFKGRRYSISRGHYRWWVWPGIGPRSAHRYGKPIGTSSFRLR
jgi:hypothetical protein